MVFVNPAVQYLIHHRRMALGNSHPNEEESKISYSEYMAGSKALPSNDWRRRDN